MSNNKKRPISDIFKSKSSKKHVNITSNNDIIINSTPIKSNNIRLPTTPGQILNKSNDLLSKKGETIFNDNIHQHIRLDVLSRKIVDTPEFQRLCKLKQLGVCNYVFRGAVHTRFEHSVGVAHLAERVVNVLRDNQPELEITNSDVLCVKIAGLCHDLGHGPFSHLYDGVFIKRMHHMYHNNNEIHWHHEEGSIQMFRHILSKNNIRLVDYGLSSTDQLFIEEIIGGVEGNDRKGRDIRKHYLYDIVNNTRSGLDVDKLDYYQRDMKNSNVTFNNNFERIIQLGRVVPAEPINESVKYISLTELQPTQMDRYTMINNQYVEISSLPLMICYPEKLVTEAVDLFRVRFNMHRVVYTHNAVKQIEFMITDALELADPYIQILGAKTEKFPDGLYKISECIYDMTALSHLNDSIIDIILYDRRPELEPAQAIINRIFTRQLYVCLGKTSFDRNSIIHTMSHETIENEIITISNYIIEGLTESKILHVLLSNDEDDQIDNDEYGDSMFSQQSQYSYKNYQPLVKNDLIVERMHLHYGLKDKNPVDRMRFYTKNKSNYYKNFLNEYIGRKVNETTYETSLPRVFEELSIRLFVRYSNKEELARKSFDLWCKKMNTHKPFPSQSQPSQFLDHNIIDDVDSYEITSPGYVSPY